MRLLIKVTLFFAVIFAIFANQTNAQIQLFDTQLANFGQKKTTSNTTPQQTSANINTNTNNTNTAASQQYQIYKKELMLSDNNPESPRYNNSNTTENFIEKSLIEKMFNNNLTQFGYDLFQNTEYYSFPGNITESYKLNIGDKVKVYLWGDAVDFLNLSQNRSIEPLIDTVVDREGNLFVPGVGTVNVLGKTLSKAEREFFSILSQKYSNFQIKLTVAQPRDFSIYVMGNVNKPGTVYIGAGSTAIEALNFASGIKKDGSLRNVLHISAKTGKATNIDLYDFLLYGKRPNIPLSSGDTILVKPIGNVIAVTAGVKRPAIYEFKEGETLGEVINFAGGFLPSTIKEDFIVERYNKNSQEKEVVNVSHSQVSHFKASNGDLIKFKDLYNKPENFVFLEGNVKVPGEFEFYQGMSLKDVIKSKDSLKNESLLDSAVIERIQGTNKDIVLVPINLNDFFNGLTNPKLQAQDIIRIYSTSNFPTVEIIGKVKNPGIIPFKNGMTLEDILGMVEVEGDPNQIVVEILNSELDKMKAIKNDIVENDKLTSLDPESNSTNNDTNNANDNLMGQIQELSKISTVVETEVKVSDDQTDQYLKRESNVSIYLYDLLTKDKVKDNYVIAPYDKIIFRPAESKEALKTVKVFGYVNNPGVFVIKPEMKITDIIEKAGGPSNNSYLKGLIFLRPYVGKTQTATLKRTILELQEEIALKLISVQRFTGTGDENIASSFLASQQSLLQVMKEKANQKYGRIILNLQNNDINSLAAYNNIELEDGDEFYIPPYPDHVIVVGEVYNQSAIAYYPNTPAEFYVDQVGGLKKEANKKDIYIVKANGSVQKAKKLATAIVEPGDSIIVPRKIKVPLNIRGIIKDFVQIGAGAAQSVYILTQL